ncbi:MAG: hypothetical protein V4649_05045 [Bacteroidota bacterium]
MFGLFKRTKIEEWETQLLKNVIEKLPSEYSRFIDQINDGLFKGVLVDISDIPGYVAFTYHSGILKKYDHKGVPDFKLTNIMVYDSRSAKFLLYEIYISSGAISGYSLGGNGKYNIDVSNIEVLDFKKEFIGVSDYARIASILSDEEISLLNQSEVYSVFVRNKEYFHIKDLEDGDFLGIDEKKVVYKITHDPLEVVAFGTTIAEVLK